MANYSLRELVGDFNMLMDMLDDPDADMEAVQNGFETVQCCIAEKVDNSTKMLETFDDRLDAIDKQIKKLEAYKKHTKNRKEWLEEYVKYAMESTGQTKIELDTKKVSIVKNGGVQPMVIDGEVPDSYLKVVYETDNKKIRDALNNGEELDFAHFVERGTHLKY